MGIQTIKTNIGTNLASLVTDGTIAGYTATDIKKDPLSADHPNYPHAYLMPPAVDSVVLDNRSVLRTYTFDIVIVINAENIASTTEVEDMIEDILNEFDNDPTMGGSALGGVLPVSSAPAPYQHNGKDLIMVVIQLQCKSDVDLSFA